MDQRRRRLRRLSVARVQAWRTLDVVDLLVKHAKLVVDWTDDGAKYATRAAYATED